MMRDIGSFRLPRSYFGNAKSGEITDLQLHVFADASETAYGCVAYFRAIVRGEVRCALVMSRSKVAPLKQISIPRLELLAAVLGARLSRTVLESHSFKVDRVVYWIDASVVLSWIRSDQRRYKQFVGFRIGEILSLTKLTDWRWVPTRLNVADQLTKWESRRVAEKELPPANSTEELRVHLLLHDVKVPDVLVDALRFSKWTVLVRTMACVFRFVSNGRRKIQGLPIETLRATGRQLKVLKQRSAASVHIPLQQNEYEKAELFLMKTAQAECFIDELKVLKRNKDRPVNQWMALEKSSSLYKLTPLVDAKGLIRMEGRVERAEFLLFDMRFPVILPSDHRITRLIVQYYHEKSGHGYRQAVKNELSYVGVDYLGPIEVTVGRRTEKRWIALFTCMVTRAVHLEVAHGWTTQSCLMAIDRFTSRRGWPFEFFSDNGTNLRGASKEIIEAVRNIGDDCADQLTTPHMGGVWERLVRSVKEVLTVIDDGRRITDEILQTAIVEAEDIVNSRPLTYVSQQSDEAEALTPNHFLKGASPNSPCAVLPTSNPAVALRDAFQRSQQLASNMWERWLKEYVPSLNTWTKWFGETRPLRAGDLVYVVEGNNRKFWIRGVVEEPIVSGDGRIRQAWIRTKSGRLKRATAKLAVMEIGEEGNSDRDLTPGTGLRAGECSGHTGVVPAASL
ncbi:uncharacterized protein LOC129761378 [Toxorhynchites rutilus septentrionalis]|uniref:uncharacterized protein LOC129761378 n=1 Tax=Toxorhynchites rutilus septentrionalis TaxID=329112 RepID=UPI0024798CBB|nr:uncharacterized protein LOC129761378 [Toxorhynchites rutilus septentrionalis]